MIITVFPGQGSQTPGFLAPWLELDGARERLEQFSSDAGVDLVAAGTEWDADRIRDTQVAQPLIVAASLLSYAALTDAVAAATAQGSLVIASAGSRAHELSIDQNEDDGARYPAGAPGALGVAATDADGVVTPVPSGPPPSR